MRKKGNFLLDAARSRLWPCLSNGNVSARPSFVEWIMSRHCTQPPSLIFPATSLYALLILI
jgi:hypothetical protein